MVRAMRLFLLGQPLLVILLTMSSAAAQTAPAEALYHRGVTEFQAGRYEQACHALAESYRLEALPGVLFTLATCEARAGRVASSAAHFQDFVGLVSRMPEDQRALQRERVQVAQAERSALVGDIPTLTITLGGVLPPGAVVRMNGAVLGAAALGRALPVDPGEHHLSVTLAGGARREQRVSVARRENLRVSLAVPAAPLAVSRGEALPPADAQRPHLRWMVASGVVGAAGLATGVTTGVLAWKQTQVVEEHCDGKLCDARGKAAADTGQTEALISTIGYGVGLVGVTVMVALHLAHKKRGKRAADGAGSIAFTRGGVGLGGSF
jgi:hypothetical protein